MCDTFEEEPEPDEIRGNRLAEGFTQQEILDHYPQLAIEDVHAALAYAAELAKENLRVLLTLDLEFGDLRKHPPGQHPGIVLFDQEALGL